MTKERWNPTPPGWTPMPERVARPHGDQIWSLARDGRVATCELRDDRDAGAGLEVILRHDDEIIIGRRCGDDAEARYVADVFRQDYARNGWTEGEAK
ncbi:MAG TPA: hypothetical protein VG871_11825 [Vicinamibacterales bacterium]|nr:hypothetical protein [Vicinamibacterales bacterium]